MNTNFTSADLILLEMAVDEIRGKFEPDSPNYIKFDLLNFKIRKLRGELEQDKNIGVD